MSLGDVERGTFSEQKPAAKPYSQHGLTPRMSLPRFKLLRNGSLGADNLEMCALRCTGALVHV